MTKKFVKGSIVYVHCLPKDATRVLDITRIDIHPYCRVEKDGSFLVDDELGKESILENPMPIENGNGLVFQLKGLHTGLRYGEHIDIEYKTDSARVHLIENYKILRDNPSSSKPGFRFN